MQNHRRIFTKRPSLWERIGNIHPAAQACTLILCLALACALAEVVCSLAGASRIGVK